VLGPESGLKARCLDRAAPESARWPEGSGDFCALRRVFSRFSAERRRGAELRYFDHWFSWNLTINSRHDDRCNFQTL